MEDDLLVGLFKLVSIRFLNVTEQRFSPFFLR